MDYSIRIGGQAGQGIQTISSVLGKLLTRRGYHVFTHQDYMSRIRGGHNFTQLRFADRPVSCSRRLIDILIALDENTVGIHGGDLAERGLVVYDSQTVGKSFDRPQFLDVPARRLAMEAAGKRLMENTVAVGAVMGILRLDLAPLEGLLHESFIGKGQAVIDQNIAAARAGHGFALDNCPRCAFAAGAVEKPARRMLVDGSAAVGMGALLAGCRFYAAYPMTPSTGLLNFMAEQGRRHSLLVEQAEDEISAINMAIGASYAGVRAMTGTAGGGFALMVEGLSLAGMTETPVVIFVGQRPAPATGLPTRTEQADLLYVLGAAHGEFPRVVMAPGSPEQAFNLTGKAFELAERYQVPAIILADTYLVDAEWTLDGLDPAQIPYQDFRLRAGALEQLEHYRRHALTASGVSPLAEPGASRHLVFTDSDEHDEDGHIIEDAATRIKMVDKRLLRKLPRIRAEMGPPLLYGEEQPETILTGWGSNYGVLKETVDALRDRHRIALMHWSEIWPLPALDKFDYLDALRGARRTICVENNAGSQFERLLRGETGFEFDSRINRFDGRPFLLDEMLERVEEIIG